jgi:GNAT superfamily N-acetyltransferase
MRCQLAQTPAEIRACYPVMAELRPQLAEEDFMTRVARQQRAGYALAYLKDHGVVQAVGGFRISESLAWGKYMYVDDLVSRAAVRSRGYGQALFQWLVAQAKSQGCETFHLDCGVQNFDAHRFYLRNRMYISSHHFRLSLTNG